MSLQHSGIARLRRLLIIGYVFASVAVSSYAQDRIAYVKDLRGDWLLNGNTTVLHTGQALPAGGRVIFRRSSAPHSFISIADLSGRTIIYRNCDNRAECNRAISLPNASSSQPSVATRIVGAVMHMWDSSVGKYVSFISRAGGVLSESVLRLEGDEVDLRPAFVNITKGKYVLRFIPVYPKTELNVNSPLNKVSFVWDPRDPKKLSLKGLAAGTYVVELLDPVDNEVLEAGTEAWVFITSGDEYERASCSFLQAQAITTQWNEDTSQETIRSFLRAYLDYLARPQMH